MLKSTSPLNAYGIKPQHSKAPLQLGTSDGDSYFRGSLDELRIYNRALNTSEIMSLYQLNVSQFENLASNATANSTSNISTNESTNPTNNNTNGGTNPTNNSTNASVPTPPPQVAPPADQPGDGAPVVGDDSGGNSGGAGNLPQKKNASTSPAQPSAGTGSVVEQTPNPDLADAKDRDENKNIINEIKNISEIPARAAESAVVSFRYRGLVFEILIAVLVLFGSFVLYLILRRRIEFYRTLAEYNN